MARVTIVDAANVVGAKPDGWWRDRAGAARRLLTAISSALLDTDGFVVVLEGQAKAAAPMGPLSDAPHVIVVHAPGEGDDQIVVQARAFLAAGHDTTIITNDRGLRQRLDEVGAHHLSVGTFRREVGY